MNEQPWSDLITFHAVSEIHEASITRFGGDASLDPIAGCVERSMGRHGTRNYMREGLTQCRAYVLQVVCCSI